MAFKKIIKRPIKVLNVKYQAHMLSVERARLCEFQSGEVLGSLCVCIDSCIEDKGETAQLHTQPSSGVSRHFFEYMSAHTGHTCKGVWVEP